MIKWKIVPNEPTPEMLRAPPENCFLFDQIYRAMLDYAPSPDPAAWLIPGNENARQDGSLDAWAWQEGEFSNPVYAVNELDKQSK